MSRSAQAHDLQSNIFDRRNPSDIPSGIIPGEGMRDCPRDQCRAGLPYQQKMWRIALLSLRNAMRSDASRLPCTTATVTHVETQSLLEFGG